MNEWQKMVYEIEEIEGQLKYGASDTPDEKRSGHKPLTPQEKDALHSRIMRIHNRMNKYIQDAIVRERLSKRT